MKDKTKLLILIDWFYPGYKAGGPIQSCINLCKVLHTQYDIYVLTTDTDHGDIIPYDGIDAGKWLYNNKFGANIFYLKKNIFSLKELAAQIKFVNADVIYLNHLFSPRFVVYPLWLLYRHIIKAKVVVCPRGALYNSALSLKSYKKKPLLFLYRVSGIHKRVVFHATNEREETAIEQYFKDSKIIIADNLPDTTQQEYTEIQKKTGTLHCIFIARIVPIKNLLFLLQRLRNLQENITVTVAGPLENEEYWQECKKEMASLPQNIIVNYIGSQKNEELPALIQKHHLFVLPTTGENFGHSIFEALLAGRPVLISDQTPWLNMTEKNAGWDSPLDEPGLFEAVIKKVAGFNQQEYNVYAKGAWHYAENYIRQSVNKNQYYSLFE